MKSSTLYRILLVCCLCIAMTTARAQSVAIPDSNFGNWLNNNGYGSCLTGNSVSGWYLDTACSVIANASYLNCQSANIHDLTGIEYFKHLDTLKCSNNKITNISRLPVTLLYFDCSGNQLTSLPSLSVVKKLICDSNQLTTLPTLPPSLLFLYCSGNQLGNLPSLPYSLLMLFCDHNHLSSLPALPTSLAVLYCDSNQLSSLPPLPGSLLDLICSGNLLTSLPPLPIQIQDFECSDNPALPCLPYIFQSHFYIFKISGTDIHCLPNHFSASFYDTNPTLMPICTPSSGCDFYYNISGNVHYDTLPTCFLDSLHPGFPVNGMKVQLKHSGKVVQQSYTSSTGAYSFNTDSSTTYIVNVDTSDMSALVACPLSGSDSVSLSLADSISQNENFGITCIFADYSVLSVTSPYIHPFRYNVFTPVSIYAGNTTMLKYHYPCGTSSGGTVTTSYTGPVHYINPAPGALAPSLISGNTLTYNIANLDSLNQGSLDVIFSTDSSALIGTIICITVIINPSHPDFVPQNDTLIICFVVHDPHDPNLKEVYPADTFNNKDWLTYTIHFQNTGNDTAYTVIVKDTLSQYVDASSFQYLASSHKAVVQLFGNAMVFTFPKINLVDSATNPPLSEGWIQYRVKAKANLPLLTQVKNTAYIYFDNNTAVATNTTVNTVDTVAALGIASITEGNIIHLYPNPNKGTFTLETSGSIHSDYTITDMLGHVIEQKNITADKQMIGLSNKAAGVYALYIYGAQPIRFVIVK